MYNKLSTK